MKQLEGKHQLPKWRGNFSIRGVADRQSMPMDLAVKEACFKGSLVDRVACVEHRLFQVKIMLLLINLFHHFVFPKSQTEKSVPLVISAQLQTSPPDSNVINHFQNSLIHHIIT